MAVRRPCPFFTFSNLMPPFKIAIDKGDVYCPQNEAWLSALRNAKKEVFIQTPDLNAEHLIPAILDACRRGIKVTYYVCLGYNDAVCLTTSLAV
jgi:hypothetical protein